MAPKTYKDLPDEVRHYLFGEDIIVAYDKIMADHGLPPGSDAPLSAVVDDVLLERVHLNDLPTHLAGKLALDDAKSMHVACDLTGRVLGPLAGVVGNIEEAVGKWCENPALFQDVKKIDIAPVAPESVIGQMLRDGGIVMVDQVMQHRLELILASYKSGVRTFDAALAALKRPTKVGGLEMSEDAARNALALIVPDTERAPAPAPASSVAEAPGVVDEKKTDVPVAPEVVQEPQAPVVQKTGATADGLTPEDEAELKAMAEKTKALAASVPPPENPKDAVARAMERIGAMIADEALRKRIEAMADARMRDVRDAFETRALLEAPAVKGGCALRGRQLVDVVEAIETVYGDYQSTRTDEIAREKQEIIRKKQEADTERHAVLQQREAELTQRIKNGAPATKPPTPNSQQPATPPLDTAKVKAAIEAVKATPSAERPKMIDIRPAPRLAGPVEELRMLSLTDFRRLSRDPKEAIMKIRDKVDLLAEQGYEKKIAGIRAWRESPISQLYLTLSQEAMLSGKGMDVILEERKASGKDSLSHEELQAVMKLNAELRF